MIFHLTPHPLFVVVDAKEKGNMGRFIQHFPLPKDIENLNIPGIDKNEIATANVQNKTISINDQFVSVMYATRDIEPGEQIAFNYGSEYWQGQPFWLFNKKGEKLVEVKYEKGKLIRAEPKLEDRFKI